MIEIEVTIQDMRSPSRFIKMPMSEYKKLIEEQASFLGILEKENDRNTEDELNETKSLIRVKSISLQEFEEQLRRVKEEMDKHRATRKENTQCPRCENGEIEDTDNFCKICGLPINREENEDE